MFILPAKSEGVLKILDHEGFLALREGATVLEADFYGEKESFPTWYESERGDEFPRRDESERW